MLYAYAMEWLDSENAGTLIAGAVGVFGTLAGSLIAVIANSINDKRRWLREERILTYTKLSLALRRFVSRLKEVEYRKSLDLDEVTALRYVQASYNALTEACVECHLNGTEAVRTLVTTVSNEASTVTLEIYDNPKAPRVESLKEIEHALARCMRVDIGASTWFKGNQRRRAVRAYTTSVRDLTNDESKSTED